MLECYTRATCQGSEGGAKLLLAMFGLSELPHIIFFGNKLKSKEVLTDKEIFVCFMVVAFKCILFPTMDQFPNTDFISILQDPESASGVDLCSLVFEHLISRILNYNKTCKQHGRKLKEFEFCYYILEVSLLIFYITFSYMVFLFCSSTSFFVFAGFDDFLFFFSFCRCMFISAFLHFLYFGARMLDQSIPRVSVWKGNLIKFFSNLDHKKNNIFGKRQLKKNLPPCYIQVC
jgi:hypothetical protein